MYTMQFDGLYRMIHVETNGYPGIMCYGWLIYRDDIVVAYGHGGYAHWQIATSNGAEYLALIAGLEALIDLNISSENITIEGDAKTIIEQMQNMVNTHSPRILRFHRQARRLCKGLKNVQWNWTPRRENHTADKLTRRALKQIRASKPTYFNTEGNIHVPPESKQGLLPILNLAIFGAKGLPN